MLSTRHKNHVRHIRSGGASLTRREREKAGMAPSLRAARRAVPDVPFPAEPERFDWFVLEVRASSEGAVAAALFAEGMAGFSPVESVPMRGNRYVRHRREMGRRTLLSGLCCVGFPANTLAQWGRILGARGVRSERFENVLGVLGMEGRPTPLPLSGLLHLHALDGRTARPRHYAPEVGGSAVIAFGQYAGLSGQVIELTEGDARLAIFGEGLFSGHAEARVPELWLDACG